MDKENYSSKFTGFSDLLYILNVRGDTHMTRDGDMAVRFSLLTRVSQLTTVG
ncbi:hypothetical protein [Paraburkholderia sp. BL6665CI2N2]|uniref:hypothetical protein n=1 Tax=Paraburkholderia sp. BL6665CI2N2 TaxID=1938806 RepID=UPI001416F0C6|nr:hypothetical protein [Paraburkholderia sp. BL6665CI2N2]